MKKKRIKPLVCYLFTGFDKSKSFFNFINNYKKYNSGCNHDLFICYKLLNNKRINILENKIKKIKHKVFIDPSTDNDWDFGSYSRFAKKFRNRVIFFMNSHSYPITDNWLNKFIKHYNKKTIIAASGSYESITNEVKLKKPFNFFSFFKKKFKAKKSFTLFPNPHLNTSSFLIYSDYFNLYIKNKKFKLKYDTWKIESGFNSLTNYFKRKNFDLLVVNSDGDKFKEGRWMLSETYYFRNQSKTIISDKHSRKYLKLSKTKRIEAQKSVWGV